MTGFQPRNEDEKELVAITHQFGDAEINRDETVLDRLVHDDFIFVTSDRDTIVGKSAFIELARTFTFTSISSDFDHVRIDGDTAIVVTTATTRLPTGATNGPFRITVTYVR